jgi:hypothetical protein
MKLAGLLAKHWLRCDCAVCTFGICVLPVPAGALRCPRVLCVLKTDLAGISTGSLVGEWIVRLGPTWPPRGTWVPSGK